MRTLLLLLISVAVLLPADESNPRVTRVIDTFTEASDAAQEAYEEAIRAAEEARAQALNRARDRALRDLKRLVNRRSDFAEQAQVYTQVLRLDREDKDAVTFFTSIGTLDNVLENLEPLVETDLLGNVAPSVIPPRSIIIRNQNYDIGVLENGSLVAPNRNYRWRDVPDELSGMRFLRFPFRDNIVPYEVDVLQSGMALIIVDTHRNRLDEGMLIDDGWEDTGMSMRINSGDGQPWKVYRKPFSSGLKPI